MPRSPKFQPPKPVGEPFRGDPKDSLPFGFTGDTPPPAVDSDTMTPWMADSAFPTVPQGPPSHSPTAPSGQHGDSGRPQFRPPPQASPKPSKEEVSRTRMAKIGLGTGIASILISPLFGPFAIALGVMSIRRGERKLGIWAVSTGAAGIVIGIIVVILVAAGVIPSLDEMLRDIKGNK